MSDWNFQYEFQVSKIYWPYLDSFYTLVHILNLILCFAKARRKKKIRKMALKRSTTIWNIQGVPNPKNKDTNEFLNRKIMVLLTSSKQQFKSYNNI